MLYAGLHPKHILPLKFFWGFSQAQQLEIIISILFTFGDISIIQHYFIVELSNLICRECSANPASFQAFRTQKIKTFGGKITFTPRRFELLDTNRQAAVDANCFVIMNGFISAMLILNNI